MGFTETWTRFLELEQTLGPSPGVRAQWHQGRPRYAVWLCRLQSPALTDRIEAIAAQLGDAIHPIPPEDTHVTVFVSGFPAAHPAYNDDVSWEVLEQQRGLLQRHFKPTTLHVGRSCSFSTAAFLEVTDPGGVLHSVRDALCTAASELRFAPYQPHVTIGVYADTRPAPPIAQVLAQWRTQAPIPILVEAMELVTFDATRQGARLQTHWRVTGA